MKNTFQESKLSPEMVRDVLLLVGYDIPKGEIACEWTLKEMTDVYRWAVRTYDTKFFTFSSKREHEKPIILKMYKEIKKDEAFLP